jgi:hypothetical protein
MKFLWQNYILVYKKVMPRKKTSECKEEQLSKMKPDLHLMKEMFRQEQFCPFSLAPSSQIPYILLAIKYIKLHQRKKQEKQVPSEE